MGRGSAEEMIEYGGMKRALGWHLQSNHYPPVPGYMLPIAERAIELALKGKWNKEIELPEGVTFRDRSTATAAQVVESYHLSAFLDNHEEEE